MSASLKPLTLEEFLAWEARQEERYEFDGTQPVAMTGASFRHALLVTRIITVLAPRLRPGCAAVANDVKVVSDRGVRYPDVLVVRGPVSPTTDRVQPTVVIEVLSPSTWLTDRRVKPADYAAVPSVQLYAMFEQEKPWTAALRRAEGWREEVVEGMGATLAMPEIGVELPLAEICRE